jgi:NHL repeat
MCQAAGLGRFVRGALAARGPSGDSNGSGAPSHRRTRVLLASLAAFALTLALASSLAGATGYVVSTFGSAGALGGQFSAPRGIAVNETGNGGVAPGTVYVVDSGNERIQSFDADGGFLRAWGKNVDSSGGSGFEICEVEADCQAGEAGGGSGEFDEIAGGVAVDETNGNVYVTDSGNFRVQEFDATGHFIRTWGADVDATTAGTEFEVCTLTSGDTCQAGIAAAIPGAFGATGSITGIGVDTSSNVYVTDPGNARLQKFDSEGHFLRMAGGGVLSAGAKGTGTVSDGSNTITAVSTTQKAFLVGQTITGIDIPAATKITAVGETTLTLSKPAAGGACASPCVEATLNVAEGVGNVPSNETEKIHQEGSFGGEFKLIFTAPNPQSVTNPQVTEGIPFNATAAEIQAALEGLTNIGPGNVAVTVDAGGNPGGGTEFGGPWTVEFKGAKGDTNVPRLESESGSVPYEGILIINDGQNGHSIGEVCSVAAECVPAQPGTALGQFTNQAPEFLAVDTTGDLYVPDESVQRVNHFNSGLAFEGDVSPELGQDGARAIAVNKATHNILYATRNSEFIFEVDPSTKEAIDVSLVPAPNWVGLAFNSTTSRTYASPHSGSSVSIFEDFPPPSVTIEAITTFDTTSASLEGNVNPNGKPLEACRFEVVKASDPKGFASAAVKLFPCDLTPAEIGEGTSPVAVGAEATGLTPDANYKVRLAVYRGAAIGIHFGEANAQTTFATEDTPAGVLTGYVAPKGTTTARLNGSVNPNNNATEVHFEYGTAGPCSANPCQSTPTESAGSEYVEPGNPFKPLSAEIEELQPGTTYFYRLVADNGVGAPVAGEERTFTTRTLAEATPPQRGDEMVSNPDKGDQNALVRPFPENAKIQLPVSADGEKAIWQVKAGAPEATTGTEAALLATRSPSGWHSRSLVPAADQQIGGGSFVYAMLGASRDFSHFFLAAYESRVLETPPATLVRLDEAGHQEILGQEGVNYEYTSYQMTDDAAHILFVNPVTEQIEDIANPVSEPLSLMPDGTPNACGLVDNGDNFGSGFGTGGSRGSGLLYQEGYGRIATTDASRIYFEAVPNGEPCSAKLALYVRNLETEETTLIDPGAFGKEPLLIRSNADGHSVAFTTASQLDPADGNTDVDVYRWDEDPAPAGTYTCLTCAVAEAKVMTGPQVGKVLVSDDFSHVYFESESQLLPGQGKQGDVNIYAASGGEISFVGDPDSNNGVLRIRAAQLSSDGNVLTFESGGSHLQLTADQLDEGNCLRLNGPLEEHGDCIELFRYEDSNGSLECLSCKQGGLTTRRVQTPANSLESFQVSADGRTTVFATGERLLPADINGSFDLYEWRDGALQLITDGETVFPKGLAAPSPVGVSDDGRNVFFTVADPGLTGFELDGLASLYDARIGGGFKPPSPQAHCSEESCQGPLEAAPSQNQPASANFSGHGNTHEGGAGRCAKGKVRRHGRCMKRHARKHHKRASHANRGRGK